jgi:hypothetical protein
VKRRRDVGEKVPCEKGRKKRNIKERKEKFVDQK